MNRCFLIGRIANDVEVRQTQSGARVASYRLAVDRNTADKEADFISCVAWNKGAEFAERFLHKGMKIAIEGRITTGSYTKQDGSKVYTTDVIVDRHEFCESKTSAAESVTATAESSTWKTENSGNSFGGNSYNDSFAPFDSAEDLPF